MQDVFLASGAGRPAVQGRVRPGAARCVAENAGLPRPRGFLPLCHADRAS